MKVLNFAHLKNQTNQVGPASYIKDEPKPAISRHGVVSFAHLKTRQPVTIEQPATTEHLRLILQRVSCIGIMKTALLVATNYCRSCPRFWSADENERKNGVVYGRCMRSDSDGVEVWRLIPLGARVYQCYYHHRQ